MTTVEVLQPEFGRRLRELRVQRGWSQRQLAATVVNPSYVSLLETGARVPTAEVVRQLARVLEVPVGDLVRGRDPALSSERDRCRLVGFILTRSSLDSGDLEDARRRVTEAYRAARAAAPNSRVILERGMVLQDMLAAAADRADGAEGAAHCERRDRLLDELIEVAEAAGLPEVLLKLQVDKAAAARDGRRLVEALRLAARAAEEIGGTDLEGTGEHVRTLGVLISIGCDAGEFAGVPRLIARMLAIAEEVGSAALLGRAHWVASVAYGLEGDADSTIRHVRHARQMLANPAMSLSVWGRFARAAASALLDAHADLAEVDRYLAAARSAFDLLDEPGDQEQGRLVEAKYALEAGDPAKAVALTWGEPHRLGVAQLIGFRRTRGLALYRSGAPVEDAARELAAAATVAEESSAYRSAARLWREVADLRALAG
jgi:transcriptional regulator with XRE-family HTH domain